MKNKLRIQIGRFLSAVLIATVLLAAFCSAAAAQQFGPWLNPQNLGATINSKCSDQHPALSKDELSLYFASDRVLDQNGNVATCAGFPNHLQLWVSHRDCLDSTDSSCDWKKPEFLKINSSVPLGGPYVASPYQDMAPNLSTDGHWLFFHSRRPDNEPAGCNPGVTVNGVVVYYQQLWAAHRQNKRDDQGWEAPINLGCTLNIPAASEAGPTFWEDDSTSPPTLYLYMNRDLFTHEDPNNPDSDPQGSDTDIYVSTCTAELDSCNRQQLWIPAAYVAELSSPFSGRDTRTALRRRDGLEMILTSSRPGDAATGFNAGGFDSWVSTRASAQDLWSIPINLNKDNQNKCTQLGIDLCPALNTPAQEGAPALSWDGQTLIFYSSRAGGSGGNDLYLSTRTKLPD